MSRTTMLLVLAAVIGYSADRFEVLENFVPVVKSVGWEAASIANAFGAFLLEGKTGPKHAFAWVGTALFVCLTLAWAVFGICEGYKKQVFPSGFQVLVLNKYWRLWAVALVTLLLPMEAVARLVCVAVRIVLVPCVFVGRLVVRVLNFDLSKLRTGTPGGLEYGDW